MTGLLVHEWIARSGGSERVLDAFADAFPEADIFCLWNDDPSRYAPGRVTESWLARTPIRNHKALALPLTIPTWRMIRRQKRYDWTLVSSHSFAHHCQLAGINRGTRKFVYAHTPARYLWDPAVDGRGSGAAARAAATVLKPLDRRRAREATAVAANSEFTRARIRRSWGIDATVIYPPVDVEKISAVADWSEHLVGEEAAVLLSLPDVFLLGASRFVPYKRLDLVIKAAEANHLPAVIAGSGPDEQRLRKIAGSVTVPVIFVIRPSDALLYALYQKSLVYVFPSIEDFGIMPVEAMAAGTPILTSDVGGGSETVALTGGGICVKSDNEQAWRDALELASRIDRKSLPKRTYKYSATIFGATVRQWVLGGGATTGRTAE